MSTTKPALTIGQTFSCAAGRYTIALTAELIANRPVYKVATTTSSVIGQPVDTLSASFGTELVARIAARRIAECLRAGANPDTTRDAVYTTVQILLAAELAAPSVNAPVVADLERAVDVFMPPPAREVADTVAAELNADLDASAQDARNRQARRPAPVLDGYEWARLRAGRAGVAR